MEGGHWEDPDVVGRIILEEIFEKVGVRDENWLDIAQDRIQWRTFVTAAMNLRVL